MIPDWLAQIRDGIATIRTSDLTPFMAPEGSDPRRGAVLLLFGEGPSGPDILLTERSHDMRSHPGQISFPGGSVDPGETAVETALREAEEETGVEKAGIEVIGSLPELWLPPSNYSVSPVIAWWRDESPVGVVDPNEVNAVLREPLDELLDPANRLTVTHPSGFFSPGFKVGPGKELILWGFTAGVLSRLFDFVGLTRPWDASVRTGLPGYMFGGQG